MSIATPLLHQNDKIGESLDQTEDSIEEITEDPIIEKKLSDVKEAKLYAIVSLCFISNELCF